jgi:hypothetical protein
MASNLKTHLRNSLAGTKVWGLRQSLRDKNQLASWEAAGRPVPPPHIVKQRVVSTYGSLFGTTVLIETGTFLGDMVYAMRKNFETIFSIELSHDLTRTATRRFRGDPHIQILQGDSANVLPKILGTLSHPSLFWLDGHYSGGTTAKAEVETPVIAELKMIFEHRISGHVILIDDARCFDGTHDYPTLDQLRNLVALRTREQHDFTVSNDVIRIHPRRPVQSEF